MIKSSFILCAVPDEWARVRGGLFSHSKMGPPIKWIKDHLTNPASYILDDDTIMWCFSDPQDAMLFKLVWA